MVRKIIKNNQAVAAKIESIFTFAILLTSVFVAANVIRSYNDGNQSLVEENSMLSEATQIAEILANHYGSLGDGSTDWPSAVTTTQSAEISSIGLRANIDEESERIILNTLLSSAVGEVNARPGIPSIVGPLTGDINTDYVYTTSSIDPDDDQVKFDFSWGDGSQVTTGYYNSGAECDKTHQWAQAGIKTIEVEASDDLDLYSGPAQIYVSIDDGSGNTAPDKPDAPYTTETMSSVLGLEYLLISPGISYDFKTKAIDFDGDQVKYRWDWYGDDTVYEWTGLYNSGVEISTPHMYFVPGVYIVTVTAFDNPDDWSSAKSDELIVFVDNKPNQPNQPIGEETPIVDLTYTWSTSANDPDADNVRYMFDWDAAGVHDYSYWTNDVLSGEYAGKQHVYTDDGEYHIKARAQSVAEIYGIKIFGFTSIWSDALIIDAYFGDGEMLNGYIPCCFPAGTKISMADGSFQNIEDIKLRDKVIGYDIENQYNVIVTVFDLVIRDKNAVYDINGDMLSPTSDHPLYVKKLDGRVGWASVNPVDSIVAYDDKVSMKLEIGDLLFNGKEWIRINTIKARIGDIRTYTFSVEEIHHNYFANSILVSNEVEGCVHTTNGSSDGAGGCNPAEGTSCITCVNDKTGEEYSCGSISSNCMCVPFPQSLPSCFPAGTKVLMADGRLKNIEDLEPEDLILNYNLEKQVFESNMVVKVFHHTSDEMSDHYLVINDDLKVTPNHPILIDGEWVDAGDLKVGDKLTNGIEIVSIKQIYNKVPVYHLLAESNHNYVVVFGDNDYIIARNGEPGNYLLGGYDEAADDIVEAEFYQATIEEFAAVSLISYHKAHVLDNYVDYEDFKEKMQCSYDIHIKLVNIHDSSQVYLDYGPEPSSADKASPYTIEVLLWNSQLIYIDEDNYKTVNIYEPCFLEVSALSGVTIE